MAPPAASARAPLLRELAAQLTSASRARCEYALRVVVIVAATVVIAETYQTLDPSISAYLVFLLVKPDRVSSILNSIVILLLVTLILAALLPVAGLLDNDPGLRLFAMAAVSLFFVFLASASKLGGPGTLIAMVSVYVIALMPTSPIGELTTRGFLHAWLFVAIPVGATIVVNLLIGPAPRVLLEQMLAADLRAAASVLRHEPDARGALDARLRAHAVGAAKLLKLTALEKTSPPEDIVALKQASLATFRLLALVAGMADEKKARPPEALAARLAALFDEMAAIFDEGRYPAEIGFAVDPDEGDVHKPLARTALAEIEAALAVFSARDPADSLAPEAPAPAEKEGFFSRDAFVNPFHTQFAVKTTLAALSCYWIYSILSWPGIHTSLLTCYLVAEHSTAESLQRASLRLTGCLTGSALGLAAIIVLFPWMTSISELLLLVSAATFIAAWIAAGGERVAYAGLQFVFAFYIATLQGYGPGFDMVQIRDRIIGVLVGILAGYIAFAYVWPNSIAGRIEANFQRLLAAFSALAQAKGRGGQTAEALRAQTLLDAVGRDLVTIAYEPDSVRPPASWLRAHRRAVDELSRLFGAVVLRPLHQPAAAAEFHARFAEAAEHVAVWPDSAGPIGSGAFRHLTRLRKSLQTLPPPEPQEGDA